uniref:Reverse transcriptase domain-containing protein n=1 Tax=Tanacetum cinerariifolium TaxID=118510 RepID=A0A699GPA1_TANCI|nr:hypothetical protein [Tanacetum cinerariifolium]
MANPLPNHVVNLPGDEQVKPEPAPTLLGFALAVLDIPNNNNGWIQEDPEEDSKIKEEEEEEMEIEDEMNDPEIINPYEIEEGKLPPPPAATVGTITSAPYHVQPLSGTTYVGSGSSHNVFSPGPMGKDVDIFHLKVKSLAQQMFEQANTEYLTLKRLSKMDRYLGKFDIKRRSETRDHYELKQSVSTLEDQMRGLMLEDKEEKEMLKKKLKVSQTEKEKMEQAFCHVVDWIHKHFGVEIPPFSRIDAIGCDDLYHFVKQCNYVLTIIMPPKAMSQAAIERLITQRVNAALEAERASQANAGMQGSNANGTGGKDSAPLVRECTFSSFMKCNPTSFHGKEGAIELC